MSLTTDLPVPLLYLELRVHLADILAFPGSQRFQIYAYISIYIYKELEVQDKLRLEDFECVFFLKMPQQKKSTGNSPTLPGCLFSMWMQWSVGASIL